MRARVGIMCALALLCVAASARGSVRVEADEVIFTLRAPDATEVYLIGDFNQWNPTVEPMNRVGDHFEVGLFLVAGDYRYQFVVDGKAVMDPDNPAPAGERGSPLILIERGDGLVLSTEVKTAAGAPTANAHPGVRYIGAMRSRDDTDFTHRVDLTIRGQYEQLRARGAVATEDTSWSSSPLSVDLWFDRGRVDVQAGKLAAEGFENDSTWTSLDPTALVGNAGVYDYDAGFLRHGVGGTISSSNVTVRAFYADATTRAPMSAVTAPQAPVDSFVTGAASDTSLYATRYTFNGSDVIAFETALDVSGNHAGIVFRREAGANPGVAADLERNGAGVDARILATRENRVVSSVWLRGDNVLGARLSGAYGWGSIKSHAYGAVTADSIAAGDAISADAATDEIDRTLPVLETRRGVVELGTRERSDLQAQARWDFTRFDFDGLHGDATADVQRITVSAADTLARWGFGLRLQYTDADYGDAPDALAIDWPELNPWLSIWDDYDPAGIVGLAFDRYHVATLGAGRAWSRVGARADVTAGLREVVEEIVHASARVHADAQVHGPWYASADGRVAWYDASAWTSDGALWSGYVEGSYRRGGIEFSVGFGFDPLVFDRVRSEYADIGYTEFLRRGALAQGVSRSRANDIVRSLIASERSFEDAAVFKLELVVDLR